MKKNLIYTAAFVLCCTFSHLASSQYDSYDLIKFLPPVNWKSNQYQGCKQYMTSGTNDYCIITVYASANSSGNLQTDFQEEWKSKVLSIASAFGNPTTQTANSGDANIMIGGQTVSMKNGGGNLFIRLTVLQVVGLRQSISISGPTEQSLGNYSADLQAFLGSIGKNDLTTIGATDNNKISTQNNGGIDKDNGYTKSTNQIAGSNNGIFYYGMQAGSSGFDYGNSKRYLYLNPSGSFRYGYSQEGYYQYNTEADRMKTPDFAGTYTRSGGNIDLSFYSGRTMRLSVNGEDLDNSLYRFVKFPQINGLMIEGSYVKADLIKDLWPNGIQPRATLHKNGRFEDQGLFGLGETVDPSLPFQEWKERTANLGKWGNGSYAIIDNSLLLSYDDGRRKQLLIYIYEEDANKTSPKLIVVGGMSFTLQ